MVRSTSLSLTWLFALQAAAAPVSSPDLGSSLQDIFSSLNASDLGQSQQILENIVPLPAPTSADEASRRLQQAYARAKPTGYIQSAAVILKQGLAGGDFKSLAAAFNKNPGGENSAVNNNSRNPRKSIYPKKSAADGIYKQTEKQMREQIYIPPTFTYGEKPPVILVPGTGARGSENFVGNLIPILQGQPYADIVWINPPGFQLADAQSNAETVAYAINYISGISKNKKVSLIGWSQASISMQWALKYWPSARSITLNQIAISADYAGTSMANLIDPNGAVPYPPSIIQQQVTSNFIRTLRSGIGSSALVPTTTIYSGNFDEIVEPQQGTSASAYLDNGNGVPVTNNEVQLVCPKGSPGAGFFTHESMLSHPLTYALIEDVLKNGGPGQPSRLNLDTVCAGTLAGPLTDAEFLLTEATIPLAFLQISLYSPKTIVEPPIRAYAR